MALTLEQENEIRSRNGMAPLDRLPESAEEKLKREQAEREKEAADKLAQDKDEEAKRNAEKAVKDKEEADKRKAEEARIKAEKGEPQEIKDLDDAALLAHLQKRNPKIKSLADLDVKPSEEEVQREAEAREADKLSWALKQGKFKKKDYENLIADSRNPHSVVINSYSQKIQAANPELRPEEVEAMVKEKFALDKDPESWQYKQGQEELTILANQIIQKAYAPIFAAENEYSAYERTQNEQSSLQAKILANAPAYRKDVEEVFNAASTYKTKIGDQEYIIPLPEEFINRAKEAVLTEGFAAPKIASGWDKQELAELAQTMIQMENRGFIDEKIAEQALLNKEKGARGIVPDLNQRRASEEKILDENQQKAAERHGAVPATAKV